ncbi:FAD-dependent monooxygenase [Sphingomonas sp.]|uniref:FAD-dependent monooxygenase n=1 Tax=Sphingomonas sp. TaxID=28214 RepID=UPI001D74A97E|nr:FAD-dependent monooxygenase [Sphingomonas sp.]MBX9797727.1 FAD-dependent monooxygenase [Sphingomonas sp.]
MVIGAGIAGLAAAIALDRSGFNVQVHERAAALTPQGAALSLWPNAIAALRVLGAAARIEAEAAPIPALGAADRTGRWIIAPVPVTRFAGCGAYLPTRALLQEVLLQVLGPNRVALGSEGWHHTDGVDLIIDASGIWSERGSAITGTKPAPAGYSGILALSDPVASTPESLGLEYWGADERFGLFDVGHGRRYWFWIAGDRLHPTGFGREAILERLQGWSASAREAVQQTPPERLIPVAINARPPPRRLVHGATICVGDAGHAMEPNLGQGAAQGLEDAIALLIAARSVEVAEIPALFERLRLARVRAVVAQSQQAALPVHGPQLLRGPMRMLLRAIPRGVNRAAVVKTHRWTPDLLARAKSLAPQAFPA